MSDANKILTVPLGRSGLKVSNLCLGAMNFGESTSEEDSLTILQEAHAAGVTFWDTANVYAKGRSEEILGAAFAKFGFRDDIVLATKAHGVMGDGANDRGLSRRHLHHAVEASLRRLRTDYIDLFQLHRYDPTTPFEETAQTLDTLVRDGKIRYWGTSTFASWQMAEAAWVSRSRGWVEPVSDQSPYNILDRRIENDRAGFLRKEGWGLVAWSPLAGGQLTGRYGANVSANTLPTGSRIERNKMWQQRTNSDAGAVSLRFVELAREHGLSPAVVAVAWVCEQGIVTAPIIGPRTIEQLRELLPAATLAVPGTLRQAIDELVPPGTAVADFLNNAGWQVGKLPGIAAAP